MLYINKHYIPFFLYFCDQIFFNFHNTGVEIAVFTEMLSEY